MKIFHTKIKQVYLDTQEKVSGAILYLMGNDYLNSLMDFSSKQQTEVINKWTKNNDGTYNIHLNKTGSGIIISDMIENLDLFNFTNEVPKNPYKPMAKKASKRLNHMSTDIFGNIEETIANYEDNKIRTVESNKWSSLGKTDHDPKYKTNIFGNPNNTRAVDKIVSSHYKNSN